MAEFDFLNAPDLFALLGHGSAADRFGFDGAHLLAEAKLDRGMEPLLVFMNSDLPAGQHLSFDSEPNGVLLQSARTGQGTRSAAIMGTDLHANHVDAFNDVLFERDTGPRLEVMR